METGFLFCWSIRSVSECERELVRVCVCVIINARKMQKNKKSNEQKHVAVAAAAVDLGESMRRNLRFKLFFFA